MKFAMNGALTIGTLDGANVEIREEAGPENFFLFGLTAEGVQHLKSGGYEPQHHYREDAELREALDLISSGFFSHGDRDLFKPLVDFLLYHDDYLLLADYRSYVDRQAEVGKHFPGRETLDPDVHPQRGPHGQILFGSGHPGLLREDLGSQANRVNWR